MDVRKSVGSPPGSVNQFQVFSQSPFTAAFPQTFTAPNTFSSQPFSTPSQPFTTSPQPFTTSPTPFTSPQPFTTPQHFKSQNSTSSQPDPFSIIPAANPFTPFTVQQPYNFSPAGHQMAQQGINATNNNSMSNPFNGSMNFKGGYGVNNSGVTGQANFFSG